MSSPDFADTDGPVRVRPRALEWIAVALWPLVSFFAANSRNDLRNAEGAERSGLGHPLAAHAPPRLGHERREAATWTSAAMAFLGQALAGCGGFTDLDFTFRAAPPDDDAVVTFNQIKLHEATAVGVIARPMDAGDEMKSSTGVVLESQNPGVLVVGPGLATDAEKDRNVAKWTFVVFGVAAGQTEVAVRIDGDLEAQIPVTVDPQ